MYLGKAHGSALGSEILHTWNSNFLHHVHKRIAIEAYP